MWNIGEHLLGEVEWIKEASWVTVLFPLQCTFQAQKAAWLSLSTKAVVARSQYATFKSLQSCSRLIYLVWNLEHTMTECYAPLVAKTKSANPKYWWRQCKLKVASQETNLAAWLLEINISLALNEPEENDLNCEKNSCKHSKRQDNEESRTLPSLKLHLYLLRFLKPWMPHCWGTDDQGLRQQNWMQGVPCTVILKEVNVVSDYQMVQKSPFVLQDQHRTTLGSSEFQSPSKAAAVILVKK